MADIPYVHAGGHRGGVEIPWLSIKPDNDQPCLGGGYPHDVIPPAQPWTRCVPAVALEVVDRG